MREKIVPIEVTPEMMKMLEICKKNKSINPELYTQYDVKRGLRDINGKGVLAGLTEIGEIHAYDTLSDGSSKPCDGKLYYHGYDVEDLIKGFIRDKRFGFEEVTYLLLFGEMSLIFSQRHFHICELFPLHLCVILSCKHRVRI